MNVPKERPNSARRRPPQQQRPTIAKRRHSIAPDGKSLEDELDEIPTAEQLEAQMKLYGRLHDDMTMSEWLGLGQPSTIAEDLAAAAQRNRQRELEFLQRYESLFGDSRERLALLPRDLIEELAALEARQEAAKLRRRRGRGGDDNSSGDDSDSDRGAAAAGGGGVASPSSSPSSQFVGGTDTSTMMIMKKSRPRRKMQEMSAENERGLGDGRVLDSDDDEGHCLLRRNSAGELLLQTQREEDEEANVSNSWQAEVALRRALIESGLSDAPIARAGETLSDDEDNDDGHDDHRYDRNGSNNNNKKKEQAKRKKQSTFADEKVKKPRRVPLSRQLLGLASSPAAQRVSRGGDGDVVSFQDVETGEELFDEDELYGKAPGEPLFIPVEPHYVGQCGGGGSEKDSRGRHDQKGSAESEKEYSASPPSSADSDDDDGDDEEEDGRSLGALALDAFNKQRSYDNNNDAYNNSSSSSQPRPVTAQLPSVAEMATLQPTAFERQLQVLLEQARALRDKMYDFVYKVEQDFWDDAQQRSLTRTESNKINIVKSAGGLMETSVHGSRGDFVSSTTSGSGGGSVCCDDDDDDDPLMFPGRGPKSETLSRLRCFIEQAVFQIDVVLSQPEPEPTEEAELLHLQNARAAARRKRMAKQQKMHHASSFTFGGGGSGGGSPSATTNLDLCAGSMNSSYSIRLTHVQSAHAILATEPSAANVGAGAAAAASSPSSFRAPQQQPGDDKKYAVVLNILATLLDTLLHRDNSIVQQTASQLEAVMAQMRDLEATSLVHVLFRDEALGEAHRVVEQIHGIVRAAARVAIHAQDEAVFRGLVQTFVAAARRMKEFSREVARIGEVALLDAADLRSRLAEAKTEHESMVVALLELADAMETQPIAVPRHAQWRRKALDELFTHLQQSMATISSLEIAADERADKTVSSVHVATHIRTMIVKERKSFELVSALFFPEEPGSVLTGVALAIAARRRLRETGRTSDAAWRFSVY